MADHDMGSDADASGEDDIDMLPGDGVPLIDPALVEAALLAEALPVPAKSSAVGVYGQAPLPAKSPYYDYGPSEPSSSQAARSQPSDGFSTHNSPMSAYPSYPEPPVYNAYPGYQPPPDHNEYYAQLRGDDPRSPSPPLGPLYSNGQPSAVAGPSASSEHGRAGSSAPKKRGESSKPRIKPTRSHHANGKKRQKAVNGGHQRDEECSFCMGSDERNREGQREVMLSCDLCGRSGHPSCLEITSPMTLQRARAYSWQCIECKTCEVCKVLGDDSRLMFCEGCDRGWHCYCLDPPKSKPPKGEFKCPRCKAEDAQTAQDGNKRSRSGSTLPNSSVFTTGPGPSQAEGSRSKPSHKKQQQPVPYEPFAASPANGSHKKKHKTSSLSVGNGYSPSPSEAVKKRKHAPAATPAPAGTVIKIRLPGAGGGSSKRRIVESPEPEEPEEPPVPFGGVLNDEDANTRATEIKEADKATFERSRANAETQLGVLLVAPSARQEVPGPAGTPSRDRQSSPALSTSSASPAPPSNPFRSLRDRVLLQQSSMPHPAPPGADHLLVGTSTRQHDVAAGGSSTVASRISCIRFGNFDIDTWYSAPYPEEYSKVPDGRLWLCEYCLKYMKSGFVAGRHAMKCKTRHPPGDEIYRDGAVSVFEVDGRKNKIYCQNLCLLAKMFLDHKTLYYDVEPFLFYVMTELDENGAQFVGYFSKEKRSPHFNVSCIMTLPIRQRRGWGNLLIDFSYLLSKKEGRLGSPEKPLSALGALSYRNYWTGTVMKYLSTAKPGITMDDIAKATSMTLDDIFATLTERDMIDVHDAPIASQDRPGNARYRKNGKSTSGTPSSSRNALLPPATAGTDAPPTHGGLARQALSRSTVAKDAPAAALPTLYTIRWDPLVVRAYLDRVAGKGLLELRPARLKYTPFLVSRIKLGQAGNSVAAMMGVEVSGGGSVAGAEAPAIGSGGLGDGKAKENGDAQDPPVADSAVNARQGGVLGGPHDQEQAMPAQAQTSLVDLEAGGSQAIEANLAVAPGDAAANGTPGTGEVAAAEASASAHAADDTDLAGSSAMIEEAVDGNSGAGNASSGADGPAEIGPADPLTDSADGATPLAAAAAPNIDLPRFLTPPPRSMRSSARTPSTAGRRGAGASPSPAKAATTTRSAHTTPVRAGRAVRKTASRA